MDQQMVTIMNENRSGYLASIDKGRPRVRPFEFQFEESGRLVFCTNNKKEIFEQLTKNPDIEFSTTSPQMVTVRIQGKVRFKDDKKAKERIISENKLVGSLYKTADNPIFEVFYLEHGDVIISDFSGNPPRKFSF